MAGLPSRAGSAPARRGSPRPRGISDSSSTLWRTFSARRSSNSLLAGACGGPCRSGVVQRRLGPSSSATTSTVDRALPSSAVQLRCWSRPTTTTRLPLLSDSGSMLGLVTPHDHGEERRLLLPPPRYRHPEHGPGDAALGGADLGVVGEVAGEADAGLGHGVPLPVAGRAVCPALGTGGRWTPWHANRPPGASGGANEVGYESGLPAVAGSGAGLVGGACGWGSGMPGT